MDIFKRMGTQKKKFKLQFFIGRLKFNSFLQGKIYVVIRRGSHKVKSQQKLQMTQENKINFNKEILELQVTLYFDQKENKYQQKFGQMNIVMIDPKENKILLGIVPFNVAEYANCGQQSIKKKQKIQQTPKKLDGAIQFNVFIKYIGQGSESSLDKISDFFFGKAKQPQSQKKVSSKTEVRSKGKIQDANVGKDLSKTDYKKDTTVNFYEVQQQEHHKTKNYVTAGKQSRQQSRAYDEDTEQIAKKFYFDETERDSNPSKSAKLRTKPRSSSMQRNKLKKNQSTQQYTREQLGQEEDIDRDSGRQNPSKQATKFTKDKSNQQLKNHPQSDKRITFQQGVQGTINPSRQYLQLEKELQNQTQQVESYKLKFEKSDSLVKRLQRELLETKTKNKAFEEEIDQYKEELQSKEEQLQEQKNFNLKNKKPIQATRNYQLVEKLEHCQKQLKRLQKQKNEVIVQNSKLKQKYKQDFKKYEQILSEKQQKQMESSGSTKADIQRLRQECSQYRETIEKLTKEKNDKSSELIKQKSENKDLNEKIADLKSALAKIRFKIANKMNEAMIKNDDAISTMLMELNQES